jgi:hypothetical protein
MCVTNAPSGLFLSHEMPFKIAFFLSRGKILWGKSLDETLVSAKNAARGLP